ncbi:hypothetical protein NliqN6_0512 [Naganishia liquefaciens]|uniref:Zn(2)-C6 fungal-type domain-containing protein n=1 Tax=Naganishia liquefaciens TaxID=104408 RepID=A0A8H3TN32_9TREE|nr:hypothetical protein NliqN6_0512 [Naganishia liquefaciens]
MTDADVDIPAASPSPPPPLDVSQLPAKRKIACLACRTIKLRCLFAAPDSAPLDPCRRCKRLELACVYQPKRRPVKPSQGEGGKTEGREGTRSPFDEDSGGGPEMTQQSSRAPYYTAQQQQQQVHPHHHHQQQQQQQQQQLQQLHRTQRPQLPQPPQHLQHHVDLPSNKRRRLPDTESGPGGNVSYGSQNADFTEGQAYAYNGNPGQDQGRMPMGEDRKFLPSDINTPFLPNNGTFRPRDSSITYVNPQQNREWPGMYDPAAEIQRLQQHALANPGMQHSQHASRLPPDPTAVMQPSMLPSNQGQVIAQDFGAPVIAQGGFPGHRDAGSVGPVVTPGSATEGSIGTGTTGTGPTQARPITSSGGASRQKGKILYTQPLSISPSSMSTAGGTAVGGFHTSSERTTRHDHGVHAAAPHQVAHPQTAPAYREYGSYLSFERDVHDVGAGPVAPPSDSDEEARAHATRGGDSEGLVSIKEEGSEGHPHGTNAEQRAMRNSMALTSILDDMKKDLRGPATSSERDRLHHHHHHHHHHHGHPHPPSERNAHLRPHPADYVTQEDSLDDRRDPTDPDGGGDGANAGSREMDIGERYNAMDIAERERKLASALDIGTGKGIGSGGPIIVELDGESAHDSRSSFSAHGSGPNGFSAGEQTQPSHHLAVPGQHQHHPSAMATARSKRGGGHRVGIADDAERAKRMAREYQRLESERMEGLEDPVTLGILDEDDVGFLFECFHDKFNAYIAILDPALHTAQYVLRTCPVLHTAICTVTAQTYAPEQYKVLLKRANFMLGKAFERGDQEIGIVQALSILSCWKEPHDRGGWLRLGYAIRMGYELGLDQPPQRPLPKDRLKALEVLNRERTWFQLAAFDRSMHSIFGRRQRMIRTETQHWIEEWITDHPEVYCYADGMLAASYPTGEMIINLRQSTPSYMEDDVGFRVMLHRTKTDIASWRERWFGEQPLAFLHPISAAIIGFYAVASDWEVADFCYRNVPKSRIPEHLADATSKAMKLLRYIVTDLAPGEIMVFAPDVITVRAARSAVFLTRLVPQLDPSVVEEIYNIFRDVVRECRRHSRGQNTTYHLAKFFASLIKISSVGPTRSASRLQTPEDGVQEQPAAVSGEALTAKLNEAAEDTADPNAVPQDLFQNDANLFVFDDSVDPLSIDALLQESQDWFSADLMAQINSDGGWNPLPGFPLPDNFNML